MSSDRVDHAGLLLNEQMACPVQHQAGLLFRCFGLHKPPIVAGARVRHILGAQGVAVRVEGNQVHVLWDDNGEELTLAGFLEAIPGELT